MTASPTTGIGLYIEPREVNLGTVHFGARLPFTARITNEGDYPVRLVSFETSCGCFADIKFSRGVCEPRKPVAMKGEIRIDSRPGNFRHRIRIETNNRDDPELILELVGCAQSLFPITPETVELAPDFLANRSAVQTVVIRNNSTEAILLQGPADLPEGISVKLVKQRLAPGEEGELIFAAAATHLLESEADTRIYTSFRDQPYVQIPLYVKPRRGIKVVPERVQLGVLSRQALSEQEITLSLVGPALSLFRIKRVTTPVFLKQTNEEGVAHEGLNLRFRLDPSVAGFGLSGEIVLDLELAKLPDRSGPKIYTFRVPVSGVVNE